MTFVLPTSLLDQSVLLDVIEQLPAGVFAKDAEDDYRFLIWNREMERIFATPRSHILGKTDYDIFDPDEASYYRRTDCGVMSGGEVIDIPQEEVSTQRGNIIAHTIKVPVTLRDGRRILLGIIEDITENLANKRKVGEYQEHLERLVEERTAALSALATTDTLTGLSNRAAFFQVLNRRIATTPPQPFSLVYLDLDRFKLINDTYGHDFGDRLLVQIGQRLRMLAPRLISMSRIGGDEFALLLGAPVHDPEVDQLCVDVLRAISVPVELDGRSLQVEGSLGICGYPDHAASARQMLQHADVAMYAAKRSRRPQRWCRFVRDLHAMSSQALEIEQGLLQALDNGELQVHYQPQYAADGSGQLHGLEALVRWPASRFGPVSAAAFMPVAEAIGLVPRITDFVMQTACADLHRLDAAGLRVPRISINISAAEMDVNGATRMAAMLSRHGVPPSRITLEITETSPMGSAEAAASAFAALRRQGLRVAIDDFGTGYSSLSYIASLPIDEIKIDRIFVSASMGAAQSARSASIIQAIVGIGAAFGLQIVAEGVETQAQLASLSRYPGMVVQGYLTGRPLPLPLLMDHLRAGSPAARAAAPDAADSPARALVGAQR